jgi:hypothetical protein
MLVLVIVLMLEQPLAFNAVSQTTIGKRQGFISESDYAAVYAAAERTEQNAQRSAEITSYLVASLNPQPTTLNSSSIGLRTPIPGWLNTCV